MADLKEVLNNFKLKSTPCRADVLTLLLQNDHALSHSDIEQRVEQSFDRVTVYRTLKTFLDKGLIHKVLDDEGVTKYALCNECSDEVHDHEHVHFKCEICGQTQCIENIRIPEIKLPEGFHSRQKNLLIQGVCTDCNV